MPWMIPAAIVGSAIVGGVLSNRSQNKAINSASDSQRYAADQAAQVQRYMYDTSRSDFSPFLNVGTQALYELAGYKPTVQTYYPPGTSQHSLQLDPALMQQFGYNQGSAQAIGQTPANTYKINPWTGNPYIRGSLSSGNGVENSSMSSGTGLSSLAQNVGTAIQPRQQFLGSTPVVQPGGAVKSGDPYDATGGAARYLQQLEDLKFQLNPEDEVYKWRQSQTEEAINRAMAARGGYNSSYAMNSLRDADMALQESEIARQYQMNYGDERTKLMDLYNMQMQLGQTGYNQLLDLVKAGQGAAGSMGTLGANTGNQLSSTYQNLGNNLSALQMAQGQNAASLWQGIGSAPLQYATLYNMMNNGSWPGLSYGGSSAAVPNYNYGYGAGYGGYGMGGV